MQIVQTFWSGGGNPLIKSFGWPHAEYNLMSWALSCCSLREHYDEVALYTDKQGYEVLIEKLNLPYTEVHVVYDDNLCLPQHWAYAKIKTYSLQTKPFLHVDGDVYVPKPISQSILKAPLIAQNREIGTIYYEEMFNKIKNCKEMRFPSRVLQGMERGIVSSYNMGFFGGNDLSYIRDFCEEAFVFMTENDLNNPQRPQSKLNINILMEQVLFATKCDIDNRTVATIHTNAVEDKGYSLKEFCNICRFEEQDFFHILGGHKNDPYMYEKLEKVLLTKYPYYYFKIFSLYTNQHDRLSTPVKCCNRLTIEHCIATYEDFLITCTERWSNLPFKEISNTEETIASGRCFFLFTNKAEQKNWQIELNPHLEKFCIPHSWPKIASRIIKDRIMQYRLCSAPQVTNLIVVVPTIYKSGIKEAILSDLGQNIISILENESTTFGSLYSRLSKSFDTSIRKKAQEMIETELEYMLYNNIIIIHKQK